MNGTIKVKGGNPLTGEATPIPNKNAIVAALPASVLSAETIIYHNVPKSTDVNLILEILKKLGAVVDDSNYNNLKINCKNLNSYKIDNELGTKMRASILFAGPLLTRFGQAEIPVPGGCVLGKRSISAHVDAFSMAGVKTTYHDHFVRFEMPKTLASHYFIWQSEASVTASENIAMYAAGTDSNFTIIDAASEPHVSELLELLIAMGANVNGVNSNKLEISGTKNLGGAEFAPGPDHVDIAGYIVAAAVTKGKIKIKGANIPEIIGSYLNWFPKFGLKLTLEDDALVVDGSGELKIDYKTSGFPMAGDDLPKFVPRPWPGFPVDSLPPIVTLACKTDGRILVQNWMYETGLDYIRELNKMGANIYMADPQKVIVSGPVNFKGGEIVSPGIIQACMAIFLAALSDPVETTIHGVDVLKRRYPHIFETYTKLGASIEIIEKP